MKNLFFLFVFVLLTFQNAFSQEGAYVQAMSKALSGLSEAHSADELLASANTFDRIAMQKEGDLWSNYYAAFAKIRSSFTMSKLEERDALLDAELARITSLQASYPNNSELEVLRGYALMSKMVADPASRGQKYSPLVAQSYGKAMELDQSNPRAMAMMARWELGSSQFFGAKPTKSCGLAQKSLELFQSDLPEGFEPRWGREVAEEVLQACAE